MALFTDGSIAGIGDLEAYESGVVEVATTERLDLTVKLGLGAQEVGVKVAKRLALEGEGGVDPMEALGKVAVTEPLKRWHALRTLTLVYRDAYYNQLNDRYRRKWEEYAKQASEAEQDLFEIGVGIVSAPIAKGSPAEVSVVSGSQGGGSYYVRMSWVDGRGAEGCASEAVGITLPAQSGLEVRAVDPPNNATGWNVYVGETAGETRLQNQEPLGLGVAWTMPAGGLAEGRIHGDGQKPERFVRTRRLNLRG